MLIVIETSDVVFAVDSIPAILAVSREQFIVFSSNAFAILGLRALYFLLADLRDKFRLLQQGLAVILAFVGVKMLIAEWYHIPTWASLGVIAVVLRSRSGCRSARTPVRPPSSTPASGPTGTSPSGVSRRRRCPTPRPIARRDSLSRLSAGSARARGCRRTPPARVPSCRQLGDGPAVRRPSLTGPGDDAGVDHDRAADGPRVRPEIGEGAVGHPATDLGTGRGEERRHVGHPHPPADHGRRVELG